MLRNDLHKLYDWVDATDMKFNTRSLNFYNLEKNKKQKLQKPTDYMIILILKAKNKSEIQA